MPALKMKAKCTTTCVREGSCLHVSRKSSKISKKSCSLAQITHEPENLDTTIQTYQNDFSKDEVSTQEHDSDELLGHKILCNGENAVHKCPSSDEDSSSTKKKDFPEPSFSSSLEKICSPFTVSSDINFKLYSAVGSEENTCMQLEDDDHNNMRNKPSDHPTYHFSDSYISEMCLAGLSTDRMSGFDIVSCNLFSEYQFSGTNLMYDETERCVMFPSDEETAETTDSQYEGSCGQFLQSSNNSWFHQMIHQAKPYGQDLDVEPSMVDSEDSDSSDPESFIRNFPDVSDECDSLPALVSKEMSNRTRKQITLVLDLDETLVHSTLEPSDIADFTVQVFFDMKEQTVYVRKRPFLQIFLERIAEMFEIFVFTASQSIYAEQLLDVLDPDGKLFSRRMYRESCIFLDGGYTKDLTVLGIDLAKVVIIDNSPQVFRLQVDNGIPIKSWFDDPCDRALISLLPFLETLVDVDDVRPIIAKKFGVKD
ncbi:CTD small phosphatase-like protein 2 [Quillaja saponaria]|uniref:CTD small phosphatase-like protein 2 n=1 Tax=Quillaja saponaria TaxID=32244 RepID=A0AAD7QL42_QUISA|nr:CTD small phosphatase-like protein 2 [Quillaja saponaria]